MGFLLLFLEDNPSFEVGMGEGLKRSSFEGGIIFADRRFCDLAIPGELGSRG